jgi:hypothetical protein
MSGEPAAATVRPVVALDAVDRIGSLIDSEEQSGLR